MKIWCSTGYSPEHISMIETNDLSIQTLKNKKQLKINNRKKSNEYILIDYEFIKDEYEKDQLFRKDKNIDIKYLFYTREGTQYESVSSLERIIKDYFKHAKIKKLLSKEIKISYDKYIQLKYDFEKLNSNNVIKFDINLLQNEDKFQEQIQLGNFNDLGKGEISKGKNINTSTGPIWLRDRNRSYMAIFNANFKCENNLDHKTFQSSIRPGQFVEAHHLIPMEFQGEFKNSIDIPENIISLCPNCHSEFHYSKNENKAILIKKFFQKRKILLHERGVHLTEKKLLEYYKI